MKLDFLAEVWEVLRSNIDINDRSDAADSLINLLIENNYDIDEIKDSFKGDKDISVALKYYASQHDTEEEYDDDVDEDEDESYD